MKQCLGAAALGFLLFVQGAAAAETQEQPEAAEGSEALTFLFTQTAEDSVLEEGSLTMSGIGAMTLYFSDAPGRLVGFLPHERFVDYWHSEDSGFVTNPPNAALVVHNDMDAPTAILELSDVAYADGKLIYTAKLLEGDAATISGPASIVIDHGGGHGGGGHGGGGHHGGGEHHGGGMHQERGSGHPLFQDYGWDDDDPARQPCNPHQGFFNDFFLCLK